MDLVKAILGCGYVWSADTEIAFGVTKGFTPKYYSLGTPVIVATEQLKSKTQMIALQPFPQYRCNTPRYYSNLRCDSFEPMDPKRLIDRKAKEIQSFNFDKVEEIVDKVSKEAGLTLIMREHDGMLEFLNGLKNLAKQFKYSSATGGFAKTDYSKHPADIFLQVSFYSLPYVIPLFTKDPGHSVGVNIGICSDQGSMLTIYREEFLSLGMNDAIFSVDGQNVRKLGFIHPEIVQRMQNIVSRDRSRKGVKAVKEEKTPKRFDKALRGSGRPYIGTVAAMNDTTATSTYTDNNSTDSGFNYSSSD